MPQEIVLTQAPIKEDETVIVETPNGPVRLSTILDEAELHMAIDVDIDRYAWNDIGNGNLFADFYKNMLRYVVERKAWYYFNGRVWEPNNEKAMELCKELARKIIGHFNRGGSKSKTKKSFLSGWRSRRGRETILKDAASVYPIKMSEFDQDPYLLNCQNRTLNLQTGQFSQHNPADLLTKMSGAYYDPHIRSDRWEQHIREVMDGDVDKAQYLQKAMGYGITGDTRYECFFLLYGATSRNGKGTTMESYMTMLGDYGRAARPETIAQKQTANGSGPSEDLARLAGARVVNISEPDKKMVLSSALVKTLTGNDTISARYLHENSFEFQPDFKLFINTNYLPRTTDATIFASGRVKVIPFEHHFDDSQQDKGLKQELAQPDNISGILNWCIEGLRLLQATGFDPPVSVLEATDQYQRDSDKFMQFIEEILIATPGSEILTQTAHDKYTRWCENNGLKAEGISGFKQGLATHGIIVKRKRPAYDPSANPRSTICDMWFR